MYVHHNVRHQQLRWVNILDREVIEENNEGNEDVDTDSDESDFDDEIDSDDSGYESNLTELTDDSETDNEQIGDLDENANRAYMVIRKVEGLPIKFLVKLTTWSEFTRQFVDEIRCRYLAGEMEVNFECTFWVEPVNFNFWFKNILRLQKKFPKLFPNFKVVDGSGII